MTDFESLTAEDIFVADVLSDIALRELQARRPSTLRRNGLARLARDVVRALTRAEPSAARSGPGVKPRVYAPAALRVARRPLPADERFFAPDVAAHPPQVHTRNRSIALMSSVAEAVYVSCELVKTPL